MSQSRIVGSLFPPQPGGLQEEVGPLQLHTRRNAPRTPVVDPLHPPGLGELQHLGHPRGPTKAVNQFSISHTAIKHHVKLERQHDVNQRRVYVGTIRAMGPKPHPALTRLLDLARQATAGSSQPVRNWPELQRRLNVSAQTLANWKRRGLSKEGALAAEREFGISPGSLLVDAAAKYPTFEAQPAVARQPTPPLEADAMLASLSALVAEAPREDLEAIADVLAAWVRQGARDRSRRATLLKLISPSGKQRRAA